MKKLLLAITILFSGLVSWAQGIPLLDKVQGQRVSFTYSYSLSQKGADFQEITGGEVTVEDNAYVMEGLGIKVLSDGETRWSLDPGAREAVVETVEKEDIFTNPALFISSYMNYMDRIKVNSQGRDNLDVTLTLDDETKARFVLKGITFKEKQGKSGFSMDEKSLSVDWVVTDMR